MSKKKKSSWPSFTAILFAYTLGLCLRPNMFTEVSLVYISGIFTLFVLPYVLVLNEDKQLRKQTEELVEKLEGGR